MKRTTLLLFVLTSILCDAENISQNNLSPFENKARQFPHNIYLGPEFFVFNTNFPMKAGIQIKGVNFFSGPA